MSTLAELAEHGTLGTPTAEPTFDIAEAKTVARNARDSDDSAPAVLGRGLHAPRYIGVAERAQGHGEHANPLDAAEVTNEQRASLLSEFLEALPCDPKLMPLGSEGKSPAIQGRCKLDSEEARSLLHDSTEAIEAVRDGHSGFCLYAGREEHGTEDLVFADHDDLSAFPMDTLPETLTTLSGSGRGFHEVFENSGDVANSKSEGGEIRAENWFIVVAGSIHPSDGVYHVCHDATVSPLSNEDIPKRLQPTSGGDSSTTTRNGCESNTPVPRLPLSTYTNEDGDTLEELRKRDDKLDALCSEEYPEDFEHDLSQIDYALCGELFKSGFGEQQVSDILRECRPRPKLDRNDYIARTVHKAKTEVEEDEDLYLADLPHVDDSGESAIKTAEARTRVQNEIRAAVESRTNTLVDAVPSLGKSYGLIQVAAETDEPLTVLTSRHDLYDQYGEWCNEAGLSYYELPSFFEACDTASGEHGKMWQTRVRGLYNAGVTASEIHRDARQYFGEPLPCEGHCGYKSAWDFEAAEYDVLVGHYSQSYNPNVVANRTVAFDEFPADSLMTELDASRVNSAVSTFLDTRQAIPFGTAADLTDARGTSEASSALSNLTVERDTRALTGDTQEENAAHALAPLLVAILLDAEDLGNGFEASTTVNGVRNRESGNVTILTPPDLVEANTVLALDGTPERSLWERSLGVDLEHRQILSDYERQEYIRDELGLRVVRTSNNVRPYSSGTWVNIPRDTALFDEIGDNHESAGLVTSKSALAEYGLVGDDGPAHGVDDTLYYGNMKGSNEFADKTAGVVSGSPHYGDAFVKRWAALCGEAAERGEQNGVNLDYGSTVGNDALRLMRESQVAQAALRFGRNGQGATVYVNTSAVPEWLPVAAEGTVGKASSGLKAVLSVVKGLPPAETFTATEVVKEVACKRQQVNNHLKALEKHGYIEGERHSGRATLWQAT